MHWSFRPDGGPSLLASFLSVILSLLGIDVFVLSSLYHLGRALLRVREIDYTVIVGDYDMILMTTLSLRGYVVGLLNANDVIDSTSIEVVHGLTTQDPYIQECYRPRPSLLIRPYKYALTRTISFGIAYLNIESRVTSLSSGTDTATH